MTTRARSKVWAYARVSTIKQDLDRQKSVVYEYANQKGFQIENFIEVKISSRKEEKKRGIPDLLKAAESGNVGTIIFSELSRLARSVGQIIRLVDELHNQHEVELHFVKEGLVFRKGEKPDMQTKIMLHLFSLFAEIERDLCSERVRDGLAARKALGVKIGRPKGSSKLDPQVEKIKELLELKVPKKYICEQVGCSGPTLGRWIARQGGLTDEENQTKRKKKRHT